MSGHSPRSLTVAVVGATGVVGRTMAQVLLERGFPVGEIRLLASARSTGTTVPFGGRKVEVVEATRRPSTGGHRPLLGRSRDLARAGPPGGGPRLHRDRQLQRLEDGAESRSSSARTTRRPRGARGDHRNPNCSTMQLVPPLMALRARSAWSESSSTPTRRSRDGGKGIAELETQIRAHVAALPKESRVYLTRLPSTPSLRSTSSSRTVHEGGVEGRHRVAQGSSTTRTCASPARPSASRSS